MVPLIDIHPQVFEANSTLSEPGHYQGYVPVESDHGVGHIRAALARPETVCVNVGYDRHPLGATELPQLRKAAGAQGYVVVVKSVRLQALVRQEASHAPTTVRLVPEEKGSALAGTAPL